MSERQKYGLVDREGLERFVKKVEELASEAQPVDRAEFERLENRLIEAEGHISQLLDNVQSMNSELLDLMERNQATHIYTVPSRQQGKSWLYERYMEAKRAEPQPDRDGWIPWHGGECPVPHYMKVDVRLEEEGERYSVTAGRFAWEDTPGVDRIKAYRPAKQEAEWPQKGETVYCLKINGEVMPIDWTGSEFDTFVRDFLGIYPTREQAEEAAGKIKRVMEHLRRGEVVWLWDRKTGNQEKVVLGD